MSTMDFRSSLFIRYKLRTPQLPFEMRTIHSSGDDDETTMRRKSSFYITLIMASSFQKIFSLLTLFYSPI